MPDALSSATAAPGVVVVVDADRAPDDLSAVLESGGLAPGHELALVWSPDGAALVPAHRAGSPLGAAVVVRGQRDTVVDAVRRVLEVLRPRLVWWSADAGRPLLAAGVSVPASWDLAGTHRLLHGGSESDPAVVWAVAHGLDPQRRPRAGQLDLPGAPTDTETTSPTEATLAHGGLGDVVVSEGFLRPDWAEHGPPDAESAVGWARAALLVLGRHAAAVATVPDPRGPLAPAPPLGVLTAWSESAAELLAVELGVRGLPLDRNVAQRLVADRIGPRPRDAAEAAATRTARDDVVRAHVPTGADTDLRNPAQVRDLLARAGITVPDTRAWRLEPFRGAHPVVAALIDWRKAERIATTYGYAWLDRDVGPDGRLRGSWTGCDGAAGRMTASAGLHNLPAELRPAVVAPPGTVLVRADLGQIEPRVLAVVSGDRAFAAATTADDLYSPVADRLAVDRPTAKIAVLAAMYGQTSGAAGEALRGLDRAYPVAMAHLRRAADAGAAGHDVRTYGGRLVHTGGPAAVEESVAAARGRFARNAVVQGAAAELFKMWAVSVRTALPPGAEIVLCLHDELLVQAPESVANDVVALVHEVLERTAARWAAGSGVRFVADISVVRRWSDAKG